MFNLLKKTDPNHSEKDILLRKWCVEIAASGSFSYNKSILEGAIDIYKFVTGSFPMEEAQEQKK